MGFISIRVAQAGPHSCAHRLQNPHIKFPLQSAVKNSDRPDQVRRRRAMPRPNRPAPSTAIASRGDRRTGALEKPRVPAAPGPVQPPETAIRPPGDRANDPLWVAMTTAAGESRPGAPFPLPFCRCRLAHRWPEGHEAGGLAGVLTRSSQETRPPRRCAGLAGAPRPGASQRSNRITLRQNCAGGGAGVQRVDRRPADHGAELVQFRGARRRSPSGH